MTQDESFGPLRIRFVTRLLLCSALAWCVPHRLDAQDSKPTPTQPSDAPSAAPSKTSEVESHLEPYFSILAKRSLFFPDIAANRGPLSVGEKFKLFVDDSIAPAQITVSAFSAAIGQASDSPTGYGQGGEGYGKRFGASMARGASQQFFGTFLLASALHQDPRFYPESNPSLLGSAKYSVKRLFVTRDDAGHNVPNWSGLLGTAMAEGLANAYWPEEERTAGATFSRMGWDLASRAGGNMLRNYWPVLFKKMRLPGIAAGGHGR